VGKEQWAFGNSYEHWSRHMEFFTTIIYETMLIMIMDNAAWHTTDKITSLPHLQLAFQPPYSPELNPVEQLWKHIRNNYTHNHFWKSLNQLENYLCDVLSKLSSTPDIIKSFSLFD